ncbi:MAG: methyltransferase domain-containing protein [Candidatus Aegiribacteria sp.]
MQNCAAEKYSRISRLYDLFEWPMERFVFRRLRIEAVDRAEGRTLEVGVGTGKNLEHYPADLDLSAIDFSPGMLDVAAEKADKLGLSNLDLREMDVEALDYEDDSFQTVISTFVFCTVPEPMAGLREIRRVLKPEGRAVFLEHMKSDSHLLNFFLHIMNVFTRLLLGTSMVRKTLDNIQAAGFEILTVENRLFDVVRIIVAGKGPGRIQSGDREESG